MCKLPSRLLPALCLLALPLALLRCLGSGSTQPNALRPDEICGVVYASDTTHQATPPLAGVPVTLYTVTVDSAGTYQWDIAASVQTDSRGSFALSGVAPGTYTLLAGAGGAQWFSEYFTLPWDDQGLYLDPIFLLPTISIAGNIQDSILSPAHRLCLSLVGTPFQDTAGAAGDFTLDRIPWGNYLFSVTAVYPQTRVTASSVLIGDPQAFADNATLRIDSASAAAMVSRQFSAAACLVSPAEAARDTGTGTITLTYQSYRIQYSVTQNP